MHLTAITSYDEVCELVEQFRERLSSREVWDDCKVGNPGHTSTCPVRVHRDLGFWVALEDADGETQSWHVFGRLDERAEDRSTTLGHICQINFSYTDDPGRVAGMFAADRRGRVYVTHSGRVGGGKPGVGKNAFLDFLATQATTLRTAEIEVPGARPTSRLILAQLDSPRLRARLAEFVDLVERFKSGDSSQPAPVARPRRGGQGYERDPAVRRAVELHAMDCVIAHYRSQKYSVEKVSDQPGELDLRCTRRGEELRVEVKGTTGAGESVELTEAEVHRARVGAPPVHLAVVSGIEVDRDADPPRASGGTLYVYKNFAPDDHTLTPTRYRCKLDPSRGHPS